MKQSLQLKIGQHLTMTPQLQQAIRLLQLSSLDLQQEIQEALYDNPLLELAEEEERKSESGSNDNDSATPDMGDESFQEDSSQQVVEPTFDTNLESDAQLEGYEQWDSDIPNDLPVDANWDDVFQPVPSLTGSAANSGESRDLDSFHTVTDSLQDHLEWQLNLTPMSDQDRNIGLAVIDSIGEDGFLTTPITEIWQGINADLPPNEDGEPAIDLDEVEAVLHLIQNFDPVGVGSSTLRECLLIQLDQLPEATANLAAAKTLVEHHLELVGSRDFKQLERKTGLVNGTLAEAIKLIQTLSPRPGEQVQSCDIEYIAPDVSVSRRDNRWQVSLNNDMTPALRINQSYAQLIRRADSSEQNRFLRDNLQEARSFIRSLESRNETLLRVSTCIVEMQLGFLEHGPEAMKPMVLADVAEQLELHESTVSRVTTRKYIETPKGVFELKYFFSSHVSTAGGGQCSSTAIRAMLKKMISEEDPAKPLSDSKLATILEDKGIQVARRTVAKYRESLNIPSSSERKRYRHSRA